ncbi:hypothetical protein GS429_07240 [Natronorubrum sp. JWXQ-INN-674]|uniref:DHHA1 domain-containing protein n=1 Tax=Natronorubrum halalkaliphilum TaxID=2691917 RepID=A0A6B0VM66_9EURY|nr:DHHA1 domain-containing protein [Natronorubrum halalkaliphilum]MXV61862.1 hypothetical protein [Natronorubrum halalkaliphilum]
MRIKVTILLAKSGTNITMTWRLIAGILFGCLIITNVFWWWRSKSSVIDTESIKEWQRPQSPSTIDRTGTSTQTLEMVTDMLNCRQEDLPEEVEQLDNRIRELNKSIDQTRQRWIDAWWSARKENPPTESEFVIDVIFTSGNFDDIEQLASSAIHQENVILLAGILDDGKFAVGVSSNLSENYAAVNIAKRIAELGEGGAGGTDQLATGGGLTRTELQEAMKQLKENINNNGIN